MLNQSTVGRLIEIIVKGSNVSTEHAIMESLRFMALNDVLINGLLTVYDLGQISFNELLAHLAVRGSAQRMLCENDLDRVNAKNLVRNPFYGVRKTQANEAMPEVPVAERRQP